MTGTASLAWFAHHEFRLAWRDWLSMLTAGKRRRARVVALAFLAFAVFMHFVAYSVVAQFAEIEVDADRGTLVVITGCALLAWSLMMSQAMESVTRAFYARSDLDLILSSPAIAQRVFAVRIATIAASTMFMAVLIAAPFINVLVWRGGARWLAAYGVVLAVGAIAAAMSVALTVALFRTIGPRRTRLAAQIVAAVIGAIFVIGLQMAAIVSYGTISQIAFLKSETLVAIVPPVESLVMVAGARHPRRHDGAARRARRRLRHARRRRSSIFSARFGEHAIAAAGVSQGSIGQRAPARAFRAASPKQMLRRKEWTLLIRDPWLASQTLMQLLYLLPPALMLWQAFGRGVDDLVLLVPVLVMAAGQFAGGLAWLAISGEDAPDLVQTAPMPAHWIVRAKFEAVRGRRRRDVRAVRAGGGDRVAARRRGRSRRHRRRGAVLDPDPALVPHPGAAQALPPPADLVARRDLRGGVLLDCLGGDRRPRRVGQMAGRDHRARSRSASSPGRARSARATSLKRSRKKTTRPEAIGRVQQSARGKGGAYAPTAAPSASR